MKRFAYRVRFVKRGLLRFLSHHDLMRQMEMAVRRADLPVAMSEGYNPRPRMSYPTATALGIESDDEVLEIECADWVPPLQLMQRLNAQLQPELAAGAVELLGPGIRYAVVRVDYAITFPPSVTMSAETCTALLARTSVPIERVRPNERKTIDLRPYLLECRLQEDGSLFLGLKVTDLGTARPDEVLRALGIDIASLDPPPRIRKTRTHIAARN
ncbi:MAG: DUF2344 domain-containing protein [Planctomycetes bacterium]|nr:DUF2344 domain-containing protein [Planctomycetota bacterium]